jgi:hypothetical protein
VIEEFLGVSAATAVTRPTTFRTILFTDLVGHTEFVAKGIEEPVRVYEVSWRR